ncbi:MAG: AMP-binding protein, partial [Dehalococcoidia bacterium]|nr:AMP-binding protein [Dehalococcoidia bacterium]
FTCGYGLTETNMSGGTVLHREEIVVEGPEAKRLFSVGKPKVNCDVRVVDENDRDVARGSGEAGEIIVRGDTVIRGYWKSPEETARAIKDGWFYTGDLATIDEDGYIYLVGRKVDTIVLGDRTIHSRDVEEVIYTHPAVLDTAVIGVAARDGRTKVLAVISLREGKTATEEEILSLCRQHLAPIAVPEGVTFIPAMPRTPSGKILKRKLREEFAEA